MTITSDDCQLRETLGNLLKASDELASAIELSSERFDTGLLDDIAPAKRELVLAANAARKILNAGTRTKTDIAKKAIAANIEAMRKMLGDAILRTSEAFEAIEAGEQNQAIGAILDLDRKLEDALALHAQPFHCTGGRRESVSRLRILRHGKRRLFSERP